MEFDGKNDMEWMNTFIDDIELLLQNLKQKAWFTEQMRMHLDEISGKQIIDRNLHMLLYPKWENIIDQICVFLKTDTTNIEQIKRV